jgi:myo-inositol-1-phosphate synthase
MKTADQLRDISAQAFDNFKAIAQNIASANGIVAQLAQVANQRAQLGLYDAGVNLNGADIASGNTVLFQQLLTEMLTNMGFNVTFSYNLNTTNVSIDWIPDNS